MVVDRCVRGTRASAETGQRGRSGTGVPLIAALHARYHEMTRAWRGFDETDLNAGSGNMTDWLSLATRCYSGTAPVQ